MTHTEATQKYPALMAYIETRSALPKWYDQLRSDEAAATSGAFEDVAAEMQQADTDFGSYPYNAEMGRFLGLPIRAGNNEPPHGYYMARQVSRHYALGVAQRRAEELIAEGKPLRIVLARAKSTGAPVRFATFAGPEQIILTGGAVTIKNGKRAGKLSSNWSVETCLQKLVLALETGAAYGETA